MSLMLLRLPGRMQRGLLSVRVLINLVVKTTLRPGGLRVGFVQ